MWAVFTVTPRLNVSIGYRVLRRRRLALLGLLLLAAAKVALGRAHTTGDARHPGSARHLVTGGVYRVTRNPIYLAMTLLLLSWAASLSNLASACVSASFRPLHPAVPDTPGGTSARLPLRAELH